MASEPRYDLTQEERIRLYEQQRNERLSKKRKLKRKRFRARFIFLILIILILFGGIFFFRHCPVQKSPDSAVSSLLPVKKVSIGDIKVPGGYDAEFTPDTIKLSENDISSENAILINLDSNKVVCERDSQKIICPASMTKILTILVATEHMDNLEKQLNDDFTITREITDYSYEHNCSAVGFLDGETVPVKDLFYGTILKSGADAAVGLAVYSCGSLENFMDEMNKKLDELGLSDTAHFTNVVGLYEEDHYCTTYDMAMILKAALQNDWCREVLAAHTYTTASTTEHPNGITISNWFLRRIEDKESCGHVQCAKTGFVDESGNCAASYFISDSGTPYIAVTVKTYSGWKCIYDHVALYAHHTS